MRLSKHYLARVQYPAAMSNARKDRGDYRAHLKKGSNKHGNLDATHPQARRGIESQLDALEEAIPTPPEESELEQLIPRCETLDYEDYPEVLTDPKAGRCYNCKLWEAIDKRLAQLEQAHKEAVVEQVREARIDELKQLRGSAAIDDYYARMPDFLEHRLAQLTEGEKNGKV